MCIHFSEGGVNMLYLLILVMCICMHMFREFAYKTGGWLSHVLKFS